MTEDSDEIEAIKNSKDYQHIKESRSNNNKSSSGLGQ